jgi:hypothetical protein
MELCGTGFDASFFQNMVSDFGIANMGSSVIQAIEMILWGGLGMMGHDSDG